MAVYKRGNTYWVRFTFRGQEIRRSAKTASRREAQAYENQLRAECQNIARGGKQRIGWNTAALRFVEEYLPTLKPSTASGYGYNIGTMEPFFGGAMLDAIDRAFINEYIAYRRRGGGTDVAIRRDLSCLSSMLSYAVECGFMEHNPLPAMRLRLKEPPPRTRYLTHTELERLASKAADHLRPVIVFAVETGMRFSEQMTLTWGQIDRERKEAYLPKTKTDIPRTVPLSAKALAQIPAQSKHPTSPYVFCKKNGRPYTTLKKSFATACKNAKLKNVRWHDLRRTCGTWLLQSGVDIYTVKQWLGHKTVATTEKSYAFLDMSILHKASETRTKHGTREPESKSGEEAES